MKNVREGGSAKKSNMWGGGRKKRCGEGGCREKYVAGGGERCQKINMCGVGEKYVGVEIFSHSTLLRISNGIARIH